MQPYWSGCAARRGNSAQKRGKLLAWSYDGAVPNRLYFTDSDEANKLIAEDPTALLVGFSLDQHWSV